MIKIFDLIHKKRDCLVFLVCVAGGIFALYVGDARSAQCTPGEKQEIIYKYANKQFYVDASKKPERFLFTQYEADKLWKQTLNKAKKRADKICG
jgi:hypothetical protein